MAQDSTAQYDVASRQDIIINASNITPYSQYLTVVKTNYLKDIFYTVFHIFNDKDEKKET